MVIDEIDSHILQELAKNSRVSYVDLAKEIGLSRVAVRERIDRLVEQGIIEQFSIVINAERLGKNISAFFEIDVEPKHLDDVASTLSDNDSVAALYQMTGPCTLHMHILVEDHKALEQFLKEHIYSLEGITRVESHILLKRYKAQNGINI
ncbi:Lrp/AsnC family transcriptional regulator [Paenibacillus beijingensis]|uniref:AsnC family transcriptional regulator n=1 Tax=Paenibacillus beijingensis TaxID=1126833 RepID=A0A0D5NQU9_9BACL|nr:Lrp/AsnC family transcriptional regulator [Paenibacillus beijingensis]AJY77674.1 AsnC family transcriptional regulator [Paenibacillus beijingensis]